MNRFKSFWFPMLMVIILSASTQVARAQEEVSKVKLDISADFMSRYIWRGLNLGGSSPSIQPGIDLTIGNFAVGAWGAYSFSHAITRQEADLYASYTIADLFNIAVTDYYLPYEDTLNKYFNYKKDQTGHLFEISAKFLGTEKLPLSLLVATNVYGADAVRENGDIQYSTYLELGYSFTVAETPCSAYLGFTPTKPDTDKGETGFYGEGPGVINLGVTAAKEIKITDKYSLPVNASLITNPQAENIFLVFGISF
ncbi:MAG: hypothetical protein IPH88_03460 [Bacteroidales bacterium]|nr:hypothetical protein [Bacteroidales bacterium]